MSFNIKKYLVDGEPASANDIFKMAGELDDNYTSGGMCFLSDAAEILRKNGCVVKNNAKFDEQEPNK